MGPKIEKHKNTQNTNNTFGHSQTYNEPHMAMMKKKRVTMMMNKRGVMTFSLFSMSSTEGVGVGGHSSFGGSFIFASSNTT